MNHAILWRSLFLWFQQALILVSLAGCLAESPQVATVASQGVSWFDGIKSVDNLGGYPVSMVIKWDLPAQESLGFRIYKLIQSGNTTSWDLVGETDSSINSYTITNLISGSLYTFKVTALDSSGAEEKNSKQLSNLAFEGVTSVNIIDKNTVNIVVGSTTGSFDELRVYAEPKDGSSAKVQVATIPGNQYSVDVTGLRTGVTYKFSVQAYLGFMGREDGNQVSIEKQTISDSFGTGASNDTNYAYRGVMNVMTYGKAPGAPVDNVNVGISPQGRLVRITWLQFAGSSASTKYHLVRSTSGQAMNTSVTAACTSATTDSCVVCTKTGAGPQTCEDTNLPNYDASTIKKAFDYSVVLVKKDLSGAEWAEELPTTNANDFKIKIPLPPDNMVLVQRDAVNYEQCQILGRATNPRRWQRCAYTGFGATPINSDPGKPTLSFDAGYFDFGYNLFVDRWNLQCNWTPQSSGGMCGSGSTAGNPQPGDCIGFSDTATADPSIDDPNFINKGKVGDVFWYLIKGNHAAYTSSNCFVKTASGWKAGHDTTLTLSQLAQMTTNDPSANGGKRPPFLAARFQADTNLSCKASSNVYGSKRLLRRREWVAAMAPARIAGEPFALTDAWARGRRQSDSLSSGHKYCSYWYNNTIESYLPSTVVTNVQTQGIAALLNPSNERANLQSSATAGQAGMYAGMGWFLFAGSRQSTECQTRFGIVEPLQRYNFLADQWTIQGSTGNRDLLSTASSIDNGANDSPGFRWNGVYGVGYATNTGYYLTNGTSSPMFAAYFNSVLGYPVVAKSTASEDLKSYSDMNALNIFDSGFFIFSWSGGIGSVLPSVATIDGGAGNWRWSHQVLSGGSITQVRCAQGAE